LGTPQVSQVNNPLENERSKVGVTLVEFFPVCFYIFWCSPSLWEKEGAGEKALGKQVQVHSVISLLIKIIGENKSSIKG